MCSQLIKTVVFYVSCFCVLSVLITNGILLILRCSEPDTTIGLVQETSLLLMNDTFCPMKDLPLSFLPEYYHLFYSSTSKEGVCYPPFSNSRCFRKVYWILCNVHFKNKHFIDYVRSQTRLKGMEEFVVNGFEQFIVNEDYFQ